MSLRRWKLDDWGQARELIHSLEASTEERTAALHATQAVHVFDRAFGGGAEDRRQELVALCQLLELEFYGTQTWSRVSTRSLREAVRREVAGGRLLIVGDQTGPVQHVIAKVESIPAPPPPAPPPPKPKPAVTPSSTKRAWVEVELADAKGVPFATKFEIEGSDGSKHEGALDAEGHIKVDDLPPGTAKVSFPDLDEDAWAAA